jgi:uncharacterized protein (TIGR00369 family)
VTREGPFWDVLEGRAAPPPAATLLGWELVTVDPEVGTIEVAFNATEQFLNPIGVIQGGLLAAMLDDTLGPALVATLGPGQYAPTTDLHAQFLRPARPGPGAAGSSAGARTSRSWPGNCSTTPASWWRSPPLRPRSAPYGPDRLT